mmetsp:Transcript_7831/g.18867  ORF Transcript_7831/g.18867 Transcript_7831/m.18867 type:complete len:346 (-) Transcript_7831:2773-3810(-)
MQYVKPNALEGTFTSSEMLDLELLPATAEEIFNLHPYCWEGTIRTVLCGTRDKKSPLMILGEHESTLVREIHSYLTKKFANRVKLTFPSKLVEQKDETVLALMKSFQEVRRGDSNGYDVSSVAFMRLGSIKFPAPNDRNVNMLPFILGRKDSLPEDLQCYYPLIAECPCNFDEFGFVGYLTVHESFVDATKAQRREGLHIESPGFFRGGANGTASFTPGQDDGWGWGSYVDDQYEGGIYMASSVSNTSEVWDALVDKKCPGIVDKHGGCEHLRSLIGKGTKLQAGELFWMTDCTPHEALPQATPGYRQFFRVVSPFVSHWYEDHSTKNPKVGLPDWVKIVKGSKF